MIGLWPSLVINIMVTFFQTQGIVLPGLIANVFGVAVTVLLNLLGKSAVPPAEPPPLPHLVDDA